MKSLQLSVIPLAMSRGVCSQCVLCQDQFGFINREHICKRCFRSVCQSCSKTKIKVYRQDKKCKDHRLCDICKVQSKTIGNYIEKYNLKILSDSHFATLWTSKITAGKTLVKPKITGAYDDEINKTFWCSLNFSLRQFVGTVITRSQLDITDFLKKLSFIVDKLTEKQSFCSLQSIIYLVAFLTCHCSESTVIRIIFSYIDYIKKCSVSKQNILKYLNSKLKDNQITGIQQFLEYGFKKFKDNLGVNIMTAELSFLVVNNVLYNLRIQEYQMAVAAYLFTSKQIICSNNDYDSVVLEMLKSTNYSQIENTISSFRKSQDLIMHSDSQSTDNHSISNQQSKFLHIQQNTSKHQNSEALKLQNQKLRKKEKQYLYSINELKSQLKKIKQPVDQINENEQDQKQRLNKTNEVSILRQTIIRKNLKINQYKQAISDLKYDLEIAKANATKHKTRKESVVQIQHKNYIEQFQHQKQMEILTKEIQSSKKQKQAVNRMNAILLNKLNELSKKITQVQGVKMNQNNKVCEQFLKQNKVIASTDLSTNEQNNCVLF